jgi:hypothetical protein
MAKAVLKVMRVSSKVLVLGSLHVLRTGDTIMHV